MTTLLTIGHSNRPAEAFLAILQTHAVATLVDIRRYPQSRYNPHFSQGPLRRQLEQAGIAYHHLPNLGGRREARANSANTAFREGGGFRGYADYMQTVNFTGALAALLHIARQSRTVIMCAEALPQNCHRLLVSDAATVQRICVTHLLDEKETQNHVLTPEMIEHNGHITYPRVSETLEMFG